MAIALRDETESTNEIGSPLVLATPTVQDDDVLILAITTQGEDPSPPAGWTLAAVQAGSVAEAWLYYRVVTDAASEPASISLPRPGSNRHMAYVASLSGVDTATPLDAPAATASTFDDATPTFPAVTTVTDGAWVVHVSGHGGATGGSAITDAAGLTTLFDGNRMEVLANAAAGTAGTVGPTTITLANAPTSAQRMVSVPFRSAATGGGGEPPPVSHPAPTAATAAPAPYTPGEHRVRDGEWVPTRPRLSTARPYTYLRPGPSVVAGAYHQAISRGEDQITTRRRLEMLATAHELRFVFQNFYETDQSTQDITVRAAIEVGGTIKPIYFHGQRDAVISRGGLAVSDPVPVGLGKGTEFYVRTFVTGGSGGTVPAGRTANQAGEAANYTNTSAGLVDSGTITNTPGAYGYGPTAVCGTANDRGGLPDVVVIGDSILQTSAESWSELVFRLAGVPYVHLPMSGEQAIQWGNSSEPMRARQQLWPGATDVLCEYGINDFNSSATTADMQLRLRRIGWRTRRLGARVHATTTTPKTTSTDGWQTIANQSNEPWEQERTDYNAWLRDGAPMDSSWTARATGSSAADTYRVGAREHLLAGVFDASAAVEADSDQSLWHPDAMSGGDGTHPTVSGRNLIATDFVTYVATHFTAEP